jgi:hypothetical protein
LLRFMLGSKQQARAATQFAVILTIERNAATR